MRKLKAIWRLIKNKEYILMTERNIDIKMPNRKALQYSDALCQVMDQEINLDYAVKEVQMLIKNSD